MVTGTSFLVGDALTRPDRRTFRLQLGALKANKAVRPSSGRKVAAQGDAADADKLGN